MHFALPEIRTRNQLTGFFIGLSLKLGKDVCVFLLLPHHLPFYGRDNKSRFSGDLFYLI